MKLRGGMTGSAWAVGVCVGGVAALCPRVSVDASAVGTGPSPGEDRANVPITTEGNTWFLHVPIGHQGPVEVRYVAEPQAVKLLRTGGALRHRYMNGALTVEPPGSWPAASGEVVVVEWTKNKWEKAIRKYEAADAKRPPKPGGILFVGSSSIRGWDLSTYFSDLPVINRGFGGSQYADALYHADRIILPYKPRVIVVYDGDNDMAAGKTAEWVLADCRALVRRIRHALPRTRIVLLSMKLSTSRWRLADRMRRGNALIKAFAEREREVFYIDAASPLLGPDGRPDPALFRKDQLHLSPAGYAKWAALVRPLLTVENKP